MNKIVLLIGSVLLPVTLFANPTPTPPAATTQPTIQQLAKIQNQSAPALTTALTAPTTTSTNSAAIPSGKPAPIQQKATTTATEVLVQLEIELSKNTKYSVFSLPNPARLIVDVKDGTATTDFDKTTFVNTPIKKVRTAKHGNDMLRIVFDLKKDLAFTTREEVLNGVNANDNNSGKKRLIIVLSTKK